MTSALLNRQVGLLEFLTTGAAIFGDRPHPVDHEALQGMDGSLLWLEARFSHDKRMEKIHAIFPRTIELIEDGWPDLVRKFVEAYPPLDIARYAHAQQFHDFICVQGAKALLALPYLIDVATCELACARVRLLYGEPEQKRSTGALGAAIRRHPAAVLLRCAYDVRPIFEAGAEAAAVAERDTRLIVAISLGSDRPQMCEVNVAVFNLVTLLDDWTDPAKLGAAPATKGLIEELAQHGIIEVHR